MLTEILFEYNSKRPEGQKQLKKVDVIKKLQEKELIQGYEYGISMWNKLDSKKQNRISIPILLELAAIFDITTDEILSHY